MKLITWNCRGSLSTKYDIICAQKPDILIVPESGNFKAHNFAINTTKPTSFYSIDDKTKGFSVFSFSDFQLEKLDTEERPFKFIAPFKISNQKESFLLLAVWTVKPYVKNLFDAIDHYSNLIGSHQTIIAGDFNSHTRFDYLSKTYSHSNLVKKLEDLNIFSAYHQHFQESPGHETKMTHLHSSTKDLFHIDYCFVSRPLLERLKSVEVGEIKNSDHAPIAFTFQLGD